jgi:hypothetical protein
MASNVAHGKTKDYAVLDNFVYNAVPRDMARDGTGCGGFSGACGWPKGEPLFHVKDGILHSYRMPIGMRCKGGFVVASDYGQSRSTTRHIARYRAFIGAGCSPGGVPVSADYALADCVLPGGMARKLRGGAVRPATAPEQIIVLTVAEQIMRDLVQDHWREAKAGGRPHLALVGVRQPRAHGDADVLSRVRAVIESAGLKLDRSEYASLRTTLADYLATVRARHSLGTM